MQLCLGTWTLANPTNSTSLRVQWKSLESCLPTMGHNRVVVLANLKCPFL